MSRTERMNESRASRAYWLNEARRFARSAFPIRFSECVRKARFHHANLMSVKLAEWA
jgi:hypothetical protein